METIANQNPSPERVIARTSECMRRLFEAGLSFDDLQKPIDDRGVRERLVRLWKMDKSIPLRFTPSMDELLAGEIMGPNLFGVNEAVVHFGVNPSKQQLVALSEIPFTQAELRECKDSHVLVAVFPISILDIRSKVNSRLFYGRSWYNKEFFAKSRGKGGWHLVSKTPVANSTSSKTWDEQQALLGKNDETPTAQVMVYTIIGHLLATDERLFENIYVRCLDVGSNGRRIYVGNIGLSGIDINDSWDDNRYSNVGVASARKSV